MTRFQRSSLDDPAGRRDLPRYEGALARVGPLAVGRARLQPGWRWSKLPCAWCPFKKTCQLDFQAAETDLTQSVGVNRAKLIRPEYDPAAARERVFKRWAGDRQMR